MTEKDSASYVRKSLPCKPLRLIYNVATLPREGCGPEDFTTCEFGPAGPLSSLRFLGHAMTALIFPRSVILPSDSYISVFITLSFLQAVLQMAQVWGRHSTFVFIQLAGWIPLFFPPGLSP